MSQGCKVLRKKNICEGVSKQCADNDWGFRAQPTRSVIRRPFKAMCESATYKTDCHMN